VQNPELFRLVIEEMEEFVVRITEGRIGTPAEPDPTAKEVQNFLRSGYYAVITVNWQKEECKLFYRSVGNASSIPGRKARP
jgi:hypothetical protein